MKTDIQGSNWHVTSTYTSVADIMAVTGWRKEIFVEIRQPKGDAASVAIAVEWTTVGSHHHHRQHSYQQQVMHLDGRQLKRF